ncbi:MAG: NAD-dependent protein deacylase [Clostridia bacterium]
MNQPQHSELEKLKEIIDNSKKIVFFGGAGVSTESGIPDFRSVDGIYNQKYDYPPEVILSHTFFVQHTSEFFKFYRERMVYTNAKPNATHYALAKLEEKNLIAVITQNIDGLHSAAGSKNVLELHGSVLRNYCSLCHKFHKVEEIMKSLDIPRCECGGIIKPDVVLYEEQLDNTVLSLSISALSIADTLIIGGTSLNVYPAASLIGAFNGKNLIVINKSTTQADRNANLVINGNISDYLSIKNLNL